MLTWSYCSKNLIISNFAHILKIGIMLRNYFVIFVFACLSIVDAYSLNGSWRGELDLKTVKLPLVFNFSETDGTTSCTLDSPNQGAKGIPAEVVFCSSDSVAVDIKAIGGSFNGKIAGNIINGQFIQRGLKFPLSLSPEESIETRRPQTPKPPFPYNEIDTMFNSADGTILGATLVIPENKSGKMPPVVVMVTGSGAQNRDEEVFEHKPFAVIADYLARNGIASLRYDDRGVGKSKGDIRNSGMDDFKSDAESGLKFVRESGLFGKAGILGHSEGGTIAMELASESVPDFIVSLAGMSVAGKDLLMDQNRRGLMKLNLDEIEIEESLQLISAFFDSLISNDASFDVDGYIKENDLGVPQQVVSSLKMNKAVASKEFIDLLKLDPSEWLGKIDVPVLALNGNLDVQVDSDSNIEKIKELVNNAKTKKYPGLNHLFQHAKTGEIGEYGEIKETISPEVLIDITSFILDQN